MLALPLILWLVRSMPCECAIAGFCKRHGVRKGAAWVALCRSRTDYFRVWEEGRGPGQPIDPAKAKQLVDANEQRIELFHELWLSIHTKQNPTPAWFEAWCSLVPKDGCGCQDWLRDYLVSNPPRYDDSFKEWAISLHCAVSRKLGKPDWVRDS